MTYSPKDEIDEEREKFYYFCKKLPLILAIIIAAVFILLGIVYYLSNPFLTLYIFIIGAVTCIVTYISLKVSLSFLHLLIHYLKKIAEKDEEEKTSHFE